jgi:hypothetical protein
LLLDLSDGMKTAFYGYVANSPLVGQIAFANNGTVRMTTTKTYDNLNRLTAILNSAGASRDTNDFNWPTRSGAWQSHFLKRHFRSQEATLQA